MSRRIITLTTDFGDEDGYVGSMKGVILGLNPKAAVVDIAHRIRPQQVREAAFVLMTACPHFPAGTIHVAVVDPGVGSTRLPIVVRAGWQLFVGPDNGILFPVCARSGLKAAWAIENPDFLLPQLSSTFHGRDVFAPAAAHLSLGKSPRRLGRRLARIQQLSFGEPVFGKRGLKGEIIHIDRFGNLITNIAAEHLRGVRNPVLLAARRRIHVLTCYSDVPSGALLAYIGSSNLVEVAVNAGSAASVLGMEAGAAVEVREGRG